MSLVRHILTWHSPVRAELEKHGTHHPGFPLELETTILLFTGSG